MWNDPAIGIEWLALEGDAEFDPTKIILSKKDKEVSVFHRISTHLLLICLIVYKSI